MYFGGGANPPEGKSKFTLRGGERGGRFREGGGPFLCANCVSGQSYSNLPPKFPCLFCEMEHNRNIKVPIRMTAAVPTVVPVFPAALATVPEGASHAELFASTQDCAGAAFALALESQRAVPGDERPWLWVQDRASLRQNGRPYRPGLPQTLRHRLIHVATTTPEDALFALEEGLRCRDLAFVVGEIAGNPRALSLTAHRRLSLAAERHGVPLWLVRLGAERDLSSARQRWALRPAASLPPRWNAQAPGPAAWHAELFRARNHPPGEWILPLYSGASTSSARADFEFATKLAQAEPVEARAHG